MKPIRAIVWLMVHDLGKNKPEGISLRDIALFSDVPFGEMIGFAEEFGWLDRRGYIVEVGLHKQPLSQKRYRSGKGIMDLII